MRMPSTINVTWAGWKRTSPPTIIKIRYSVPLRFRLGLALLLARVVAWLVGGTADVKCIDEDA